MNNQPVTVSAPLPIQHPKREIVSVESDEESTVRPLRSGASTQVGTRTQQSRKPESAAIKNPPTFPSSSREVAAEPPVRPATPSRARTSSVPKKRLQWYLEFANRISTAEVLHGPIPFDVISEQLVLDDDAVRSFFKLYARQLLTLHTQIGHRYWKVCYLFSPSFCFVVLNVDSVVAWSSSAAMTRAFTVPMATSHLFTDLSSLMAHREHT